MKLGVTLDILNQRGTPAFFADTFANRPAAGFTGRVFISTDTFDLYRDTGTTWVLLSPSSSGTITGTGTTNTLPLWTSASAIGNSALTQNTGVSISIGSVGTPYDFIGYGNNYAAKFIKNGASATDILAGDGTSITAGTGISISGGQISATGSAGVTGSGSLGQVSYWSGSSSITGTNNFFWDSANNHLGIGTNTPGTSLDIHHNQSTLIQLNQTTFGNDCRIAFQNTGTANWRIGNFYNFGTNDFGIQNASFGQIYFSVKSTGQTFVGDNSPTTNGLFVINNVASDNHLQVLGANAPSIRINNGGVGSTYSIGIGLSTASNNFIQGTGGGEMCIFNQTSTPNPILFGISNFGVVSEAARISSQRNLLVNSTTDTGQSLQINGKAKIIDNTFNTTELNFASFNLLTNQMMSEYKIQNASSQDIYKYEGSFNKTSIGIQFGPTNIILMSNLPTFNPGTPGQLWNNGGVVNIV